jgi:ribonuclease HI
MDDIWSLCDHHWSPQCKVTIIAAIINLINTIWLARNQARYRDQDLGWRAAISHIIASTALTGNYTKKSSSNSIRDFSILKFFHISIHPPRAPILKEVVWHPPIISWIKCNTDGASSGNPGTTSCGGVFRNHFSDFVFAFAEPLGVQTSLFAETCGVLRAIEVAYENNWHNLWIETDSTSVVAAFTNPKKLVAWSLRNRWKNVKFMLSQMNYIITHTYREANTVADHLANMGLSLFSYTAWSLAPSFISEDMARNKLGFPGFRICLS